LADSAGLVFIRGCSRARYHDFGLGFYDTHISNSRKMRNHVRQLQALGYKVTLEPAA
jgi:transposase